jgi:hypothetical protein
MGESKMLKKLWLDEGGALLSVELILLIVITVIGISVGMVVLRDAVVTQFQSLAAALESVDPGYAWGSLSYAGANDSAYVNGSVYSTATIAVGAGLINNDVTGNDLLVPQPMGALAEIIASP